MPPEPVLVLAGPGTGKTRVLIARIVWTIRQQNILPENILALTFTNKAASEIKQRLIAVEGVKGENVWTGTIHGFAFQILRKYHNRIGLDRHFTICDSIYQNHLISELCAPHIRENLEGKVRGILLAFSHHITKGRNLPPFAAARYLEYKAYLDQHKLIDFDQILVKCHQLFSENPDVRTQYQHQYKAILVDEFQDTDSVQYDLLKMLAENHRNIFVVADDDQSIYTWRGASPENIRKFIQDFLIERPILLKINYRSGARIIDAATRVIEKTERLEREKPLEIYEQGEHEVAIHFFNNEKQEVEFLTHRIRGWNDQGTHFRDMAVIYPFHRIGQSLEQYFIQSQIPYQMARGQSILDHPSIRKMILYLRLTLDPEDYIALEQLTEQETGQALFNMIKLHARKQRISFRKALYMYYRNEDSRLDRDMNIRIQRFVMQLANLVNLRDFYRFAQVMFDIYHFVTDSQIKSLESEINHLEDIEELIASERGLQCFDPGERYNIYHSDPKIIFLAEKLLQKTGIPVAGENETTVRYLALSEPPEKNDKAFIPLYKLKNNFRQGSMTCLFKFLQWQLAGHQMFEAYVVLDLETTDRDPETCDIVEVAAVRVRNGKVTDELESLIKPEKNIHPAAQAVHGISSDQLTDKPSIREFWPELRAFIGDDIIIAHNGYNFDFPILDRFARIFDGSKLANVRFDTLVLARNLFPGGSNSIDSLMNRYGLSSDKRHRALEDVKLLSTIFVNLQLARKSIARKISFEMFLDIVSLGDYIENKINEQEDRLFFIGGARKLITPYSGIMTEFTRKFGLGDQDLSAAIHSQLERLQPGFLHFSQDENLIIRLREMASEFNHLPVREAITGFLGQIALQQAQDELNDINAVSLLTYHAAKGLEFDKVILIGLENDNMPGFHASRQNEEDDRPVTKKMEEQRRLFYVGMTRAKSELIMTAVRNRGGWERKSSPFLKDIQTSVAIKSDLLGSGKVK